LFSKTSSFRSKAAAAWKAGALAHGQKQWIEIGMLLAQNAKLLLVDETAAGLTDEETHRTGELLRSLAGEHTIIVIEHDMVFGAPDRDREKGHRAPPRRRFL
jgi:urea transport system ATP-binding protein